ncbi:MAG: hypothetical protein ACK4IT_03085 [Thioalkalivibrionaceae bacterium]
MNGSSFRLHVSPVASSASRSLSGSLREMWWVEGERRRVLREGLAFLPLVAVLGVFSGGAGALSGGALANTAMLSGGSISSAQWSIGFDPGLPSASAVLTSRSAVLDAASSVSQVQPLRPQTPPPMFELADVPNDEPETVGVATQRAAADRAVDRDADPRARVER